MNVAIVLAGLTPRAKQIDGMGFGGAPAWKFEDRVALLAGLKGPALDWAYYRYCGHDSRLLPVLRHIQLCIDMYCGVNKIRIKRETRAGIVKVAMMDITATICQSCGGNGYHERQVITHDANNLNDLSTEKYECPSCRGTGRNRLSGREMALLCGIDHKSWTNTHDVLLYESTRLLVALDIEVYSNAHMNHHDDCC